MNTLLTFEQQKELVNQKLAVESVDGDFSTFKYHRRVMRDYIWDTDPRLLECRGHVYNNKTGELIQAAPRKSFNYLERGHWSDVSIDQDVIMYKKINGFMAAATMYNGELFVSTTGSTKSEYAQWAKEEIMKNDFHAKIIDQYRSTLFEIVVEHDPHIVKENLGAHLLGYRFKDDGFWLPVAYSTKPIETNLGNAIKIASENKGEGYMMYKVDTDSSMVNTHDCCKLKTPYYTGKKKLMRMSQANVNMMYNKPKKIEAILPDMWVPAVQMIIKNFSKDIWSVMKDQQRRTYLEEIENDVLHF